MLHAVKGLATPRLLEMAERQSPDGNKRPRVPVRPPLHEVVTRGQPTPTQRMQLRYVHAQPPLSLFNRESRYTRKMVHITGRASYFWSFQQKLIERRGDRTDLSIYTRFSTDYYKYTHHLTLFIIHNKHVYEHYIYIHTYMNCSSQLY